MVLEVPSITPGELHDLMRLHQDAEWPECKKNVPPGLMIFPLVNHPIFPFSCNGQIAIRC
nr:CLL_HP1_G0004410.mRNA.1.CDS.1 [Saccharomyces cerevisiae]